MNLSSAFKFWGIIACIFMAFFWIFHASLLPFIIGLILAYILNPLVDCLEKHNVSRLIATNLVLSSFVALIILFFLLFIPILSEQITTFISNLPNYHQKTIKFLSNYLGAEAYNMLPIDKIDYQKYLTDNAKSALGITGNVINKIIINLLAIVKNITFLIIIPIVAFYFLLDWHVLISKVYSWLPRKHATTIKSLIKQMDALQSGFIRGQVLVCCIQAVFYMSVLSFIGLDYSITLGFITGILTFIPYIGAGIGFIIILLVACVQYLPDYYPIIFICITFAVGQFLEGYVWIPQIVGGSVSLHPLWIMFSLLAFGSILGLSGMLIAVPVTAAIGVMTRYAFEKYRESKYYDANNSI